jgi:uncharacterized protein (DUF486 family)
VLHPPTRVEEAEQEECSANGCEVLARQVHFIRGQVVSAWCGIRSEATLKVGVRVPADIAIAEWLCSVMSIRIQTRNISEQISKSIQEVSLYKMFVLFCFKT